MKITSKKDLQKRETTNICPINFICLIFEYLISILSFYYCISSFLILNSCTCNLNVAVLQINQNNECIFGTEDIGYYLLSTEIYNSMKDCNFVAKEEEFTSKVFRFMYSDDSFLKFGFFNNKIIDKRTDITICINENEYLDFLYFIKIVGNKDHIIMMELNMFFNTLKYLNILKVERDENYYEFIKNMVFNVQNFTVEYIKRFGMEILLDYKHYNKFNILDIVECFFEFHFFSRYDIYITFHRYKQITFIGSRKNQTKLKKYKNIVSMQLIGSNFLEYLRVVNTFPVCIWEILRKLLCVDRFYIGDIKNSYEAIDMNKFIYFLPEKINKIAIYASYNLLLIDKLYYIGFLGAIKNVQIIHNDFPKALIDKMYFFKETEILKFEIFRMNTHELDLLENHSILQFIRIFKLIITQIDYLENQTPKEFLSGMRNNLFIDSSVENKISDVKEIYRKPFIDGYFTYLYGIDLDFYIKTYNQSNFNGKFNSEKISRLKMNLKNANDNFLEDYDFLSPLKSLKSLYLLNIKLTNKLLENILNCKNLDSVYFKTFEYDKNLDHKYFDIFNTSIIYLYFEDLKNPLDRELFYFLERCNSLQHLIFKRIFILNKGEEYYDTIDQKLGFHIPPSLSTMPKLKTLKVKNIHEFSYRIPISILNLLSKFFNLEDLEKLTYCVFSLYQDDLIVFMKFERLLCFNLNCFECNLVPNLLENILQTNIKNTVKILRVHMVKFISPVFVRIFYFKNLRILKIGLRLVSETDKKSLEPFKRINYTILEVYKILSEFKYSYSFNCSRMIIVFHSRNQE